MTIPRPLMPDTYPAPINRMERYQVASFVHDVRSISSDPGLIGDPRDPVPHLAVKPQAPGIETNQTI